MALSAARVGTVVPLLDPNRVIGIDPGLTVTGYAVLERRGSSSAAMIEAGVIRPRGDDLARKLAWLHKAVADVIKSFPASAVALEQVHSRVAFPRTALLMAHARGVIVLAAAERGVPVHDYAPSRIKKTLTGNGRASKEQMQHAVMTELGLGRLPEPHDVADACALAICHLAIARIARGLAGA